MHSTKEVSQKIGLIAGQGALPAALIKRWEETGLTPVIVALDGITPPSLCDDKISATFSIGQAGHILEFFKSQGVKQLVMAGALKRPNFWTLRTDLYGLKIVLKLLFKKMGDDTLLRNIRREIETFGISVAGAHEFLPEILSPVGILGKIMPTNEDLQIIQAGFIAAKDHGANDKGQSVIVNESGVLGFEDVHGTNALIASCAGANHALLVKVSKPQQDLALDMPTIGLSTVKNILTSGLRGIAVEAGKTIILDRDDVIRMCDDNGLFLVGVEGVGHDV